MLPQVLAVTIEHNQPFILVSDNSCFIPYRDGVPANLGLLTTLVVDVIDKGDIVRYSFNSQFTPYGHGGEAMGILKYTNRLIWNFSLSIMS